MNLDLKSEKINYMKPVFKRRFTREETIEVIVPDALPDILRLVDTDGIPYLRSKDADVGRLTVSGICEISVLYVPESGGRLQKLNVNLPFTASADASDISSDCSITAKVTLLSADSKTVNSRKIVVRAEVLCDAVCYMPEGVSLCSAGELKDVYTRNDSAAAKLPSAVNEKTFIFTDELKMSSSAPAIGEILKMSVRLDTDDVKPVGNKAVIKGSALTEILYSVRDSGEIERASFTTPFSQIVETDSEREPVDFDVLLMLTGAYLSRDYLDDSDGEALSLEIHAVAQCVPYTDYAMDFLTDAYSVKYSLNLTRATYDFDCLRSTEAITDTVKGLITLNSALSKVSSVSVRPSQVTSAVQDGKLILTSNITVSVICMDENGGLISAAKKIETRHEFEPDGGVCNAEMSCGEPFASISGSDVELRIPVEMRIKKFSQKNINLVETINFDETHIKDLTAIPSIVVIRHEKSSDLWVLAKKYDSSIEAILSVSGFNSEDEIPAGALLLIPKIR